MARSRAEDWAAAALEAMADGGVAAVRVEALAPLVGATKGSFYWHFADRAAVIEAALARWEHDSTEAVIAELEGVKDPRNRLRRVFAIAFRNPRAGQVEAALAAQADHPLVAPVLARVTERRLTFMRKAYREMGFKKKAARHRALAAYTAYVGLFTVRRAAPGTVPEPVDAYLDELLGLLDRH
jgi:AcrR family transcriptional regulator